MVMRLLTVLLKAERERKTLTAEEPGLKLDEGNRQNFCWSKARTQRGLQHKDQEVELQGVGEHFYIYICRKQVCLEHLIKKCVKINCKMKPMMWGIENKTGKLASSLIPGLNSLFAISATACAQSVEDTERKTWGGGRGDWVLGTLSLAEVATKKCKCPFLCKIMKQADVTSPANAKYKKYSCATSSSPSMDFLF